MTWKLSRLRQCEKCPWKVSTNPRDIPHGYSEELHRGLSDTITEPGALRGNCENIGQVQLDGPQHQRFEDTLPRD